MVVPAALSAERLPAPATRGSRGSLALSLALHGLILVPLLLAGMAGSNASDEPALMVELSFAAPTAGPAAEAKTDQPETKEQPSETPRETPPDPQLPSVEETAAALPPPEPTPELSLEPEIKVELPPPQEPPPLKAADLKPADVKPPDVKPATPPKPKAAPPPKPAAARPTGDAATTSAPDPNAGDARATQQASAASAPLIVFEGRPRYRHPPTPPVYPQRAIELNQQGEALVRVRLDPDGSAAEILLWRGSGFALLDRAALTAVRGWHFLPAMRDGRPVAAWVEIPVRFHLR